MLGLESVPPALQPAATVGVVLVEAMLLYVGYGALTRALGPLVERLIVGE